MSLIQKIADWYYFELRLWLKVLFNLNYWVTYGSVDKKWDQELKAMLIDRENLKVEQCDCGYIKINGLKIWSRHYPFGVFRYNNRHPFRRRVMLLMEILKQDYPEIYRTIRSD